MRYIDEINSFYSWLETNSISSPAIVLWHALMNVCNKTGWKQEFNVAISVLELKTGLSRSAIYRARNVLKQSGRIDFSSRGSKQSSNYSIISFASQIDTQSGTQSDTQGGTQADTHGGTQSGTHDGTQSDTIPRHRLDKTRLYKESKPKKKKFVPPTVEEIRAYCEERNNNVNPEAFYHYYNSRGWRVGRNKEAMTSWKSSVITWELNDYGNRERAAENQPKSKPKYTYGEG